MGAREPRQVADLLGHDADQGFYPILPDAGLVAIVLTVPFRFEGYVVNKCYASVEEWCQ